MISALAPALRARSASPTIRSRVPSQYIWKNVCGFSVTTSSIGLLANELSPIAVPARAAGARHRHLTGRVDALRARRRHHDRERDLLADDGGRQPARAAEPGRHLRYEGELAEGGDVLFDGDPLLEPGEQRGVDRLRQPLLREALRLGDRLEHTGSLDHRVDAIKQPLVRSRKPKGG